MNIEYIRYILNKKIINKTKQKKIVKTCRGLCERANGQARKCGMGQPPRRYARHLVSRADKKASNKPPRATTRAARGLSFAGAAFTESAAISLSRNAKRKTHTTRNLFRRRSARAIYLRGNDINSNNKTHPIFIHLFGKRPKSACACATPPDAIK